MKIKPILLSLLMLLGLTGTTRAQNLVVNGTFDVNTPAPQSSFICNATPWGWQASVSPTYSPLSGVQWEYRWHTSWWVDITDCGYGNGRWIKQDVNTTIGQSYLIGGNILANAWYTAGVDVYLNGALVYHYENINNGNPSVMDWEQFQFCWVATSTVTELKLVANSSSGAACPVNGLDDIYMIPGTGDFPFEITLSNECVPAVVGFNTGVMGTPTWYYNGGFLATGVNNVAANQPGTYTVEYQTACGTVVKDTTVVICDTCKPTKDIREFCLGDPTLFDFAFDPNCISPDCIGDFSITYGDGGSGSASAGNPLSFSYTYANVGTYKVKYCWVNTCDGRTYCDSTEITIIDCDTCEPILQAYDFCEGEPTHFDFTFPDCFDRKCWGRMTVHYGDGTVQGIPAPGPYNFSHVYPGAGSYTVRYCWVNRCTGKETCKTIKIDIEKCDCEPDAQIYQFCLGQPTNFDFFLDKECMECIHDIEVRTDDNGIVLNGGQPFQFQHVYSAIGFYTVEYCWTNHCTGEHKCKTRVIEIINCDEMEPCQIDVDFNFTPCNPVHFTALVTANYPIVGYTWDFGDGTMGMGGPGIVHNYPQVPGVYRVCLTVYVQMPDGQICEKQICKDIYVQPCEPSDGEWPTDPGDGGDVLIGSQLKLYPNPAQDKANVYGIVPEMKVNRVLVFGIDGKQLQEISVAKGETQVEIPLGKLEKGTYIVRVLGAGDPVTLKLVKE